MDSLNFCYWLGGFYEIGQVETLTARQVAEIKNHLKLVLDKPPMFGQFNSQPLSFGPKHNGFAGMVSITC